MSPANLTSLTLSASGTGNDQTGISSVSLYLDVNGNGLVDGGDSLLGTTVYGSNNGAGTINFTQSIPAGGANTFLVVDNFSPTASGTFITSLANSTALSGSNAAGPALFSGWPLNGAVITVAAATQTPTNTPLNTMTLTPTPTPSFTPTATATRSFTQTFTPTPTSSYTSTPTFSSTATSTHTPPDQIIISPPYPNPVENGPVDFLVQAPGSSMVKWSVFTAAFRKVVDGNVSINGAGVVQWDLRDKTNSRVANGLYYVRVDVSGNFAYSRIWTVIVLR